MRGFTVAMWSNFILFLCFSLVNGSVLDTNHDLLSDQQQDEKTDEKPMYSLPKDIVFPSHYNLKITPDLRKSTWTGSVEIIIYIGKATKEIQLFSKNLDITKCAIKRKDTTTDCTTTSDKDKDLLTITSQTQLEEKTEYSVVLLYTGKFNDDMKGFYRTSYNEDGVTKYLAITHFEPIYAREAFPCFDEPHFKTTFSIQITTNAGEQAISNMPFQEGNDDPTNPRLRIITFQRSQPMPTYLVAFMVSEWTRDDGKETVDIWARLYALEYTTYAVSQGRKLLNAFEEFTSVPYPLPKLDIVAVPDLKIGATENWGMTIYKERYVILDESKSSLNQKMTVTEIISRQFSQQWFGNILTPSKWDYLWLKGGFATYFEYYGTAMIEPNWNSEERFVLEVLQPCLWKEMTNPRPIATSITLPSQFQSMYDVISYDKAGCILRMIKYIMSPIAFKSAIQTYIINGRNKYGGSVNPDHLIEAFDTIVKSDSSIKIPSGTSIAQIFKSWAENTGYPSVHVERSLTTNKFQFYDVNHLTGYLFGYTGHSIHNQATKRTETSSNKIPVDQKWIIPISCATKSSPTFDAYTPSVWLIDDSDVELPSPVNEDEWIICNLEHAGYYRVRYSHENWVLLIKAIAGNPKSIPSLSKAQLVDDAFALALDDALPHGIPFKLVDAMRSDTDLIPWISVVPHLSTIWSKYGDASTALHPPFSNSLKTFIEELIMPKIRHFGFDVKETDSTLTRTARTAMLSLLCGELKIQFCLDLALKEYKKNSADLSKVQPDLKAIVYCAVISDDANKNLIWNDLWSLYEKTEISYDKQTILSAFACVEEESFIERTLITLKRSVRKQDHKYFINALSRSSLSITAALKYIKNTITFSDPDQDTFSTLTSIFASIEPGLQTDTHLKLLQDTESNLLRRENPSLLKLTNAISAILKVLPQRIQENKLVSSNLKDIITDIKNPDLETFKPPTDVTTAKPTSAAITLLQFDFYSLLSSSFVLYMRRFI